MKNIYILILRQYIPIAWAQVTQDSILGVYSTYTSANDVRLKLKNKDQCIIEEFKLDD